MSLTLVFETQVLDTLAPQPHTFLRILTYARLRTRWRLCVADQTVSGPNFFYFYSLLNIFISMNKKFYFLFLFLHSHRPRPLSVVLLRLLRHQP